MANDTSGFVQLCEKFATIDLLGDGPPIRPSDDELEQAIRRGRVFLPQIYRDNYVEPLLKNLSVIIQRLQDTPTLETLTGVVYEHGLRKDIWQPLGRFLAVISNLYRSFLSKEKMAAIDVPFDAPLPPLAMFQQSGALGPFTIPSDQVNQLIGAPIGVVSLPATYRHDPLLWATLAHETGGHDITHAVPDLLPELKREILASFGLGLLRPDQPPEGRLLDGLLWNYWMDEAAADVYGLLNIGPVFVLNQSAFFAAFRNRGDGLPIPSLGTRSGVAPSSPNPLALDPHPTDILRLHLAIGVIENLKDLSPQTRTSYINQLEQVAILCARGSNTIEIQGEVALTSDVWIPIDTQRPLSDMQQSARQVGTYLATAKLQALDDHSIQDIETWSDADEVTAQLIMAALLDGESVVDRGDDAQLLAGATLAVLTRPRRYETVTELLAQALDNSFAHDPILGLPTPHPVIMRYSTV